MDSFQRSQYSIFNKNKTSAEPTDNKPELTVETPVSHQETKTG